MSELRKVQKVGYSTLAVSLPRRWVKEQSVRRGDLLSMTELPDGALLLESPSAGSKDVTATVSGDLCRGNQLLFRVITGCYLLGYDGIRIVWSSAPSQEHLNEISEAVERLLGLEVVEQTMRRVILQSFVDPTKFPVDGLMKRLHAVTASMLNAAIAALAGGRPQLLNEVSRLEQKVDQLYWLIIRQLLLSLRVREVGAKIGIDSSLHAAGDRVAAKTIEDIADFLEGVAEDISALHEMQYRMTQDVKEQILRLGATVQELFGKAMKAFLTRDIRLANEDLEIIEKVHGEIDKFRPMLESIGNPAAAMALRSAVWRLRQIATNCGIIAELSINRFLRTPSDICTFT